MDEFSAAKDLARIQIVRTILEDIKSAPKEERAQVEVLLKKWALAIYHQTPRLED